MSRSVVVLLGALAAAAAVGLLLPPRGRWPAPVESAVRRGPELSLLGRHRVAGSVLAGLAAVMFIGGPVGVGAAVAVGLASWTAIGRVESPAVRRRAEEVRRDLPALVTLLAAALRSGAAPADALTAVATALPGAAADRLDSVAARLRLGDDPAAAWGDLARDPDLGPLGRTLARAQLSGAPVVAAVDRLAGDLAAAARAGVEDRARAVGVKAAVPLGLCLLPAFVLIGIVPLVAGLVGTLTW